MSEEDKNKKYRKIASLLVGTVLAATIASVSLGSVIGTNSDLHKRQHKSPKNSSPKANYLVDSKKCKVPNSKPSSLNDRENIEYFQKIPFKCDSTVPLTQTETKDKVGFPLVLQIKEDAAKEYSVTDIEKLKCCYKVISRKNDDENDISEDCEEFKSGHEFKNAIEAAHLYIECEDDDDLIYSNVHSSVIPVSTSRRALSRKFVAPGKILPYSVLLWGIAGPSLMSLERSWKQTKNFLTTDNHWIHMKGFSKSGSKFDTLYSMLTGRSPHEKYGDCDPKSGGYLDGCDFIWKDFRKAGYHTGYGEDQLKYNTFNMKHKGFKDPPTHSYFRPAEIAIEALLDAEKTYNDKIVCSSIKYYLEYLFGFKEKLQSFDSMFGVVISNSFNELHLSSAVMSDSIMTSYLKKSADFWHAHGRMIVVFFSDAALRFEKGEKGFYEERIPFLYIWLPDEFIKEHPALAAQLRKNADKLFSAYDVYLFLRQILKFSVPDTELVAPGCKACKSLFNALPTERGCKEANIPQKMCPCEPDPLNPNIESNRRALFHAFEDLTEAKCNEKIELVSVSDVKVAPYDAYNMSYLVRFKTTNSLDEQEVLMSRKPFTIFSNPKFEILAKKNINTTICHDQREIIMTKLLEKVTENDTNQDYSDVKLGMN